MRKGVKDAEEERGGMVVGKKEMTLDVF